MEVYNAIIQAVSTVGFPIVCCLIMIKNNNDLQNAHREETDNLRKVIENNTLSITKLYEKIDTLIDTVKKWKRGVTNGRY